MQRKWCGDSGWFSFTTSKSESTVILDDDDDDDDWVVALKYPQTVYLTQLLIVVN